MARRRESELRFAFGENTLCILRDEEVRYYITVWPRPKAEHYNGQRWARIYPEFRVIGYPYHPPRKKPDPQLTLFDAAPPKPGISKQEAYEALRKSMPFHVAFHDHHRAPASEPICLKPERPDRTGKSNSDRLRDPGRHCILAIPGNKFDAGGLDLMAAIPVDDLARFKHIEQPKDWNLPALKNVCELMGIAPGQAKLITQSKDEPVQELRQALQQRVDRLVMTDQRIQNGLLFWNKNILSDAEREQYRTLLGSTKGFLESLLVYKTPGQFKNFRYSADQVQEQAKGINALAELQSIQDLLADLAGVATYLSQAEMTLPEDHEWIVRMRDTRTKLLQDISDGKKRNSAGFRQKSTQTMKALQDEYIQIYLDLHRAARLGVNDDKKKASLLRDERLVQLRDLATIDLMPAGQISDYLNRLAELRSCFALTKDDLQSSPACPHCEYRPINEPKAGPAGMRLKDLDEQLDRLTVNWTKSLLDNLADPVTQENLALLKPKQRKMVEEFLQAGILPSGLTAPFIGALKEVLSGLIKIPVTMMALQDALLSGGSPATPEELKKRFEEFISRISKGKDVGKVRIVLQ